MSTLWYKDKGSWISAACKNSNQNLLINGDFKIWQRGTVFENITETIYSADRWILIGNTQAVMMMKKEAQGALIIGTVIQKIELCLRGEIVTISAKIDNHIFEQTTDIITDTWKSYTINQDGKNIIFAVQTTTANITIFEMYLQNTNSQIPYHVEWVKLEYGNSFTGYHPDPILEEITACRWYYYKSSSMGHVMYEYGESTFKYLCFVEIDRMRAIPNIAKLEYMYYDGSGNSVTGIGSDIQISSTILRFKTQYGVRMNSRCFGIMVTFIYDSEL